jgi:hypothetical protein
MSQTTWRRFFATFVAVASLTTIPILVDWIVKETSVALALVLSVVLAFALTWLVHLLIPNLRLWRASRRESKRKGKVEQKFERNVKYLLFSFAPGNSIAPSNAPTEPALKSLLQKSVEFFDPDELFLLVSSESKVEAVKLGSHYEYKNTDGEETKIKCHRVEIWKEKEKDLSHLSIDSQAIEENFRRLVEDENEINYGEVVVDITGGTKSMSVSAYLFADSVGAIPVYSAPGGEGYIILSKT